MGLPGTGASSGKNQAENVISPLVLDLDADGIELISLQNSQAFFDLDADGFAEQTGWVKPDDGLLALDKNNNGQIDNIGELFGNATTDGFIILKQLDSNQDNIIDNRDTQFANLRVWKDADSNGFTDPGELQSLTVWGINAIDLNYQTTNLTNEGNRISSTSTYTLADGTTQEIVDVWFSLSQLNTTYIEDFQLKTETLFLPSLRGYGRLPDLYIAMSEDATLLGMMRNLVQLDTQNYKQFHGQFLTQVDTLLYRWAKVDNIDPNVQRGYFNSRKLGFLEKFTGEPFNQNGWGANPGPQASNILQATWDNLYRQLVGRLLVQGAMRDFFPQTSFNYSSDRLESDTSLASIINTLVANTPTSLDQAGMYWTLAVAALDAFEERFGLTQDVFDTQISQALTNVGLAGFFNDLRQPEYFQIFSDVIFGTANNDTLNGGVGNDLINAGAGDDFISGGAGNDILEGASGNDTVNGDDGDDIVKAGLGSDILDGGSGKDTLKLDLSAFTTNLVIENPINSTTLPGVASLKNFEQINLTTGSGSDSIIQGSIINGAVFRSSDIFNGGMGDDVIDAGLGLNDRVDGGAGNDTLIVDYSVDDVGDRIQFFLGEITSNGIVGGIARNTADKSDWLDSVGFAGIENFQITGTRIDDEITTWNGNDIINAGAGNDNINPGTGTNTVNAGDGNDQITLIPGDTNVDGGTGTDTLVIDLTAQTAGFNLTLDSNTIPEIGKFENIEYLIVRGSNDNDTVNLSQAVGFGIYNRGVRVRTAAGNDNVTGGSGADWILGEAGNDILNGGIGLDRLEGGDGDDILNGGASNDNSYGLVAGGNKRGGLFGGAGNDTLDGGDGNDYLDPGSGVDTVIGGMGHDEMVLNFSTATGSITVTYTNINDGKVSNGTTFQEIEQIYLATGSGNDTVNLSATVGGLSNYGNDVGLGAGSDSVSSGSGADALYGQAGDDTLDGEIGRDYLDGGDGDDILRGGAGDDNQFALAVGAKRSGLFGGTGNDSLFGGDGNDLLNGGAGDDILQGDAGADGFLFDSNAAFSTELIGRDTIVDFVTGSDNIILDKTTFTTLTSPANKSLSARDFAVIDESVNGAAVAGTSSASIVFNRFTGDLFYNSDGTTVGLGSGGYFAQLSGVSSLGATDFILQA